MQVSTYILAVPRRNQNGSPCGQFAKDIDGVHWFRFCLRLIAHLSFQKARPSCFKPSTLSLVAKSGGFVDGAAPARCGFFSFSRGVQSLLSSRELVGPTLGMLWRSLKHVHEGARMLTGIHLFVLPRVSFFSGLCYFASANRMPGLVPGPPKCTESSFFPDVRRFLAHETSVCFCDLRDCRLETGRCTCPKQVDPRSLLFDVSVQF